MFFAYVIKCLNTGCIYKGHCENLENRLTQHNAGQTRSLKNKGPFEVIYSEEFNTREEAIKREKYFKTAAGRNYLRSRLK